ncbi:MAG: glycosyl hydrolase family 17 protein [Myxococcota bacterium]
MGNKGGAGRRQTLAALGVAVLLQSACGGSSSEPGPATGASAAATGDEEEAPTTERRVFAPRVNGQPVLRGISYGPYREGQRPGGPDPSEEEILEDLRILAERWQMLRIYGSPPPAETIVRLVREHDLPLKVMVGAWIEPESRDGNPIPSHVAANATQVREAIRLANAYPDVVTAVNIGNESQVFWSAHRTAPEVLIGYLRQTRAAIEQPVTTADDYNFWNKPESAAVAAEVDFLLLHAYAMWNRQQLGEAVEWTAQVVRDIAAAHPDLKIVIGETGWATVLDPDASGDEATQIVGSAGEEEQRVFYEGFMAWAEEAQVPYFYFEAFDEPWKGGEDPRGVEKHWGLYTVDREPKLAIREPSASAAAP